MRNKVDSCKGCIYYIKAGSYWVCDYITIAGHRRPCPAGAGCTVKETEDEMKERWDKVRALELYQAGLPEDQIADDVGVKPSTICRWRRENGLPAHKAERQPLPAHPIPAPAPEPPAPAEAECPVPQSVVPQEETLDPERTSPGGPMELHLELGGGWARIRAPSWAQAAKLWKMMETCIGALEAGGAADG